MKRFVFILCAIFMSAFAFAQTIRWHVGDSIIRTDTCSSGDSVTPPTAPAKTGWHFTRWDGYTQIEYLESTGTQYIDTGVIITGDNTDINITMSIVSTQSQKGNVPFFFGAGAPWVASLALTSSLFQCTVYGSAFYYPYTINEKHTHHLVLGTNSAQYYVDNILKGTYDNLTTVNGQHSIVLFARNYNSDIGYFSYMKLYGFSISMNNTLVRDLVPVLDTNGVACMFDKVTKQFFYNQGTGNFIAGPVINE